MNKQLIVNECESYFTSEIVRLEGISRDLCCVIEGAGRDPDGVLFRISPEGKAEETHYCAAIVEESVGAEGFREGSAEPMLVLLVDAVLRFLGKHGSVGFVPTPGSVSFLVTTVERLDRGYEVRCEVRLCR